MAIAITLTVVGGVSAARGQLPEQSDESTPRAVDEQNGQTIESQSLQESGSSNPLIAPQSDFSDEPASAQVFPSPSQVELPFNDVPPDHWAYEALLFLSTGSR